MDVPQPLPKYASLLRLRRSNEEGRRETSLYPDYIV